MYDLASLVWPITMYDVETFYTTSVLTLFIYSYVFGPVTKYRIKRCEKKEGKEAARDYAKHALEFDKTMIEHIFGWNIRRAARKYLND